MHAQALHGCGDLLGQTRSGVRALARQHPRLRHQRRMGLALGALQAVQVGSCVQLRQPPAPLRKHCGQVFGRALVAPCQRDPLRDAGVQFSQPLGVEFGAPGVAAQGVRHVVKLRNAGADQL